MGHKTIMRYSHLTQAEKRSAIDRLPSGQKTATDTTTRTGGEEDYQPAGGAIVKHVCIIS
jgi:hypothetical protein